MAVIKAVSFKNWCTENISPQCWPRILLKSLDTLRLEGLNLNDMGDPPADMDLSPELLEALNSALLQIYDIQIEEGVLNSTD